MTTIESWAQQVISSVEQVFLGKREVIEQFLVALLCRGHVLIEDVPGLGKTIAARALAASIGGLFSRVQCTPDLLPTDILGVSVFNPQDGEFHFRQGPIHANVVLVDEVNRATPRTQSALLQAMAENQISVEGRTVPLPDPFFVMATENPVEFEGTFPLPEAQKDRFFLSLHVGYPEREVEKQIVEQQRRMTHPVDDIKQVTDPETIRTMQEAVLSVFVDETVFDYMLNLVEASRQAPGVRIGVSPRGTLALYKGSQALAALHGRDFVLPDDVKRLVHGVFDKRIILNADAQIKGLSAEAVVDRVLGSIPVPLLERRS
ncbi:MAG TPA: MoxR family ATPase [Spirochaetia bacterium]|nr:MoxR family ATPase [Spirochaetia bacterium]